MEEKNSSFRRTITRVVNRPVERGWIGENNNYHRSAAGVVTKVVRVCEARARGVVEFTTVTRIP